MRRLASLIALGLCGLLAPAAARADRPATVAMGIGASVESTPLGVRAVATPISLDAGAALAAPLWWHVTASFGSATLADHQGDGHLFGLRTGPRLERCWDGTTCLGAGLELGWGHARWAAMDATSTVTRDGLDLGATLHAAVAIDPRRKVFLAATAGLAARYAVRTDDPARWATGDRLDTAASVGVAFVVRN
ncbi:MAG: hypothetical protein JNK64_06275 [Myxococcales bacterium]|nr:hypothetical protein [Myxococcales bacterium]